MQFSQHNVLKSQVLLKFYICICFNDSAAAITLHNSMFYMLYYVFHVFLHENKFLICVQTSPHSITLSKELDWGL